MAVNKNFVVKNGLEVDTNTLFVDSANNRVAIGTTVPTASLDVRGKILSDSQVESWVGKFVGIVTAGAVGVTTLTYSVGTGSSTKLGRANAEELNVTAGFTTFLSASATDIIVSFGSTFSKDLNVGAAATVGAALTVTGGAKIALDSRFEKALEIGEDLNVGAAATITGISTFTGAAKFAANSRFEKSLAIGEDLNVGGATTVGGALTVTGNAYFNGNVDVGGDLTFDEVNARNATITGIATVGFSTSANAYIAGITTSSLLHVGMGATMVKVQGTPATRVGINSIGPAFTLDVDGDINSTGTVRQAGTSVLTTASGDATALAIALG
jgi:acyl-[acyl carrier protein]--UDP-N-acetylglucosamine O-acyltransferase